MPEVFRALGICRLPVLEWAQPAIIMERYFRALWCKAVSGCHV
jgi:hypothetical protein